MARFTTEMSDVEIMKTFDALRDAGETPLAVRLLTNWATAEPDLGFGPGDWFRWPGSRYAHRLTEIDREAGTFSFDRSRYLADGHEFRDVQGSLRLSSFAPDSWVAA